MLDLSGNPHRTVTASGLRLSAIRTASRNRNMTAGDSDTPSPPTPCRVLLLEDDKHLREHFARILDAWPGCELVDACETLQQAMVLLHAQPVDLLITDLQLPDGHGTQAIRLLRALKPAADALVISVLANETTVVEAIEAGAAGYLLKDADSIELLEAIEELRAGRSPISPAIARVIVRRLSARSGDVGVIPGDSIDPACAPPPAQAKLLTQRETEILQGIAKGYTYAELAQHLGISMQTVPVHIRNIYRKLEASNRSEAVYEASRLGLIQL